MAYDAVRTDEGIEIRDGDTVVTVVDTWPPREPAGLEDLFEDANVSQPMKGLLKLLFGVEGLQDER